MQLRCHNRLPSRPNCAALWREHRQRESTSVWTDIGSLPMTPTVINARLGFNQQTVKSTRSPTPATCRAVGNCEAWSMARAGVLPSTSLATPKHLPSCPVPNVGRQIRLGVRRVVTHSFHHSQQLSQVRVSSGDELKGGDVAIVIEAMKMLHSVTASGAATVAKFLSLSVIKLPAVKNSSD